MSKWSPYWKFLKVS